MPSTEHADQMDSVENDHNVYILGAGFSAGAGLPVIKNFLLRLRDSHPWLEQQGRHDEARAVQRVLEFRLKAASAAYWVTLDLENIEELFSLASISEDSVGEDSLNGAIKLAIAATIDFAASGTNPADKVNPAILPYRNHVEILLGKYQGGEIKGKNTFITFNYDTVLDETLRFLKVPFSYGGKSADWNSDDSVNSLDHGPNSQVDVLKLHGSVNWARSTDPNDRSKLTLYGSYEALRAKKLIPELIPPTWKKVFQSPLDKVWESAVHRLKTATRIIIIGFSCPPTDMHFKYLMASGLQENVSLRHILFVNPSSTELRDRATKLFRESYIRPDVGLWDDDKWRIQFFEHGLDIFIPEVATNKLIGRTPQVANRLNP